MRKKLKTFLVLMIIAMSGSMIAMDYEDTKKRVVIDNITYSCNDEVGLTILQLLAENLKPEEFEYKLLNLGDTKNIYHDFLVIKHERFVSGVNGSRKALRSKELYGLQALLNEVHAVDEKDGLSAFDLNAPWCNKRFD